MEKGEILPSTLIDLTVCVVTLKCWITKTQLPKKTLAFTVTEVKHARFAYGTWCFLANCAFDLLWMLWLLVPQHLSQYFTALSHQHIPSADFPPISLAPNYQSLPLMRHTFKQPPLSLGGTLQSPVTGVDVPNVRGRLNWNNPACVLPSRFRPPSFLMEPIWGIFCCTCQFVMPLQYVRLLQYRWRQGEHFLSAGWMATALQLNKYIYINMCVCVCRQSYPGITVISSSIHPLYESMSSWMSAYLRPECEFISRVFAVGLACLPLSLLFVCSASCLRHTFLSRRREFPPLGARLRGDLASEAT